MQRKALSCLAATLCMVSAMARGEVAGVRIGVLNDQSGIYADMGGKGSIEAARLAVEDFTAASAGANKGMKIEIISADHQNKADIGSAIAREWYDQKGVDLIVDIPNSSVALAVQAVAQDKGKLAIFSGASSSDLTNAKCSPNSFAWTYDTYGLAKGTAGALTRGAEDSWFFVTADYAFGQALERDAAAVVTAGKGKVIGSVRAPLDTPDYSSFLLKAQGSGAKYIGLANAGGDTITSIKQAGEFGLTDGGQTLAGLVVYLTDVHALGLSTARGLLLTASFYWDLNDETRAWSKRFHERTNRMPTMVQAGVYSGVLHYLKAVSAAGTTDAMTVAGQMRKTPVKDMMTDNAVLREDGKLARDMYLFQVKSPADSKAPWDYYKLVRRIPAGEVVRPLAESQCPLVRK